MQDTEQARLQDYAIISGIDFLELEGVYLNGHATQRLAGNLNVSVGKCRWSGLNCGITAVFSDLDRGSL
jgi:hypothetical protein